MECDESQHFVSALYDGDHIPADAADHINGCAVCRQQLQDYAAMSAELKLMATRAAETPPMSEWLPKATQRRGRLFRLQALTARVMVPRIALILGVMFVLGLSTWLGSIWAQGREKLFYFEVSCPQAAGMQWSANVHPGGEAGWGSDLKQGPVSAEFQVLEIREGVVRLAVRTHAFKAVPTHAEEARALTSAPPQEFRYLPGQVLQIPVSWGTLMLKGRVVEQPQKATWENQSIEPWPNQIVLKGPVLLKGKELLFQGPEFAAESSGENPAVSLDIPGDGRFVFRLKSFEGAVAGLADFSQARFQINGYDYLLSCATPITSGAQPRAIWVSRNPNYTPSK